MDRRRRRARALGLAFTLAVAGGALAADAAPPLRAMRWLPADADVVRLLTTEPSECLATPIEPERRLAVEVGRAAFRTPVLLGGQAARAGLSCESCHRAGRGNPDFQFPGASGEPGTADVTLSLFSSHRGNGVHDPRPIPDLSLGQSARKVARDDVPAFVRGLIVEEFDGPEPPAAVLAGVVAYVDALSPTACPRAAVAPVGPEGLMADARRALVSGHALLSQGDRPAAVLMVAAARARLGLIDERYAGLPAEQTRLRAADAELAALQADIRTGAPAAPARLDRWLSDSQALEGRLARSQARSLFDPARLSQATKRRLPPRPS